MRITAGIEDHDFEFKLKHAQEFLKDGDKVKVSIRFKGREMNYTSLGEQVLLKFADQIKDMGTVEKRPKLEGRSMTLILAPVLAPKDDK